jgi:hypothetical protein
MEFDEVISFAKANAPAIAFVTGAVIVGRFGEGGVGPRNQLFLDL